MVGKRKGRFLEGAVLWRFFFVAILSGFGLSTTEAAIVLDTPVTTVASINISDIRDSDDASLPLGMISLHVNSNGYGMFYLSHTPFYGSEGLLGYSVLCDRAGPVSCKGIPYGPASSEGNVLIGRFWIKLNRRLDDLSDYTTTVTLSVVPD